MARKTQDSQGQGDMPEVCLSMLACQYFSRAWLASFVSFFADLYFERRAMVSPVHFNQVKFLLTSTGTRVMGPCFREHFTLIDSLFY